MKLIPNYFTSVYQNSDQYIYIKAIHTSYVLLVISMTIIIEAVVAILAGTTNFMGVVIDLISVLAFIGVLYIVKSGRLILAGNIFVLAGMYKILEYYNINFIHQFYLQCLIVLIVCTIMYVKLYQFYILFSFTLLAVISRYFYISYIIDRNYMLSNELLHQSAQVTVGMIVFSIVLSFYDQVIIKEIRNGEKLKIIAETDVLTSLYNRQKFEDIVTNHIQKDGSYCFAIIDIDHFKWINDRYGHAIGDKVLIKFSELFKEYFKNGEFLFRWGGEEFTIISTSSISFEDFRTQLNDFRKIIANTDFGTSQLLTISIGFACSSQYPSIDRVLVGADKALYYAKEHGRNRVDSSLEVAND